MSFQLKGNSSEIKTDSTYFLSHESFPICYYIAFFGSMGHDFIWYWTYNGNATLTNSSGETLAKISNRVPNILGANDWQTVGTKNGSSEFVNVKLKLSNVSTKKL